KAKLFLSILGRPRWQAPPADVRFLCGKICVPALRWNNGRLTGRITQYPTKAAISNKSAASSISISAVAENKSRRAKKSSSVNLTELNDEDRHQNYLCFSPHAFGRSTDPFQRSVFRRPDQYLGDGYAYARRHE